MIIRRTQKRSEQSTQLLTPARSKHPSRQQTHRPERTQRTAFQELILNPRVEATDRPGGSTTRRTSRMFTLGSLEKDHHSQSSASKRKAPHAFQPSLMSKTCARHPSKPATHHIASQVTYTTVYCEKCAIELASKGCQMARIAPTPDKQKYDEEDLDRFMGSLNSVLNQMIRRKEESTINIIKCETEYGRQIEVVNQYFGHLQHILEKEKNRHYNSILNVKKQAETGLKKLYSLYENCILEMNRILDNIVLGRRSTVNCYDSIMDEYSPKIEKYNSILNMDLNKFTIKHINLVDIDQIGDALSRLLQVQYDDLCSTRKPTKQSINIIPAISNVKTIVTEYRQCEGQYEYEPDSETNLLTQQSEIDLDRLLESVTSPR